MKHAISDQVMGRCVVMIISLRTNCLRLGPYATDKLVSSFVSHDFKS